MADRSAVSGGGPVAKMRAARRRASLFVAPESARAKATVLLSLLVLVAVAAFLTIAIGVQAVPVTALGVPIVLGGFLLDRAALRVLLVATAAAVIAEIADIGWREARVGSLVILAVL